MFKALIEGFALGLSTGSLCLMTCVPIYLPYMMSEERSLLKSLGRLMEISLGRFIAYILFGALAGYFGTRINPMGRGLFTGISYILLSIFLVINAFRTHREGKSCRVPKWALMSKSALLLGFFTGVNFCPSFLIALSSAVDLGGVLSGIQIFVGFFFGTSLFLMPLALSGYLTFIKGIKYLARIATILIAIWFIWQGFGNLVKVYQDYQHNRNTVMLDLQTHPFKPVVVSSPADSLESFDISDSLLAIYRTAPILLNQDKPVLSELPQAGDEILILISANCFSDSLSPLMLSDYHHIILQDHQAWHKLPGFLRTTIFRLDKGKRLQFKI